MCNRHVYPTAISTFTSDYTLLLNYYMSVIMAPNLCYNSCWDKGFCDRQDGGKCWVEEWLLTDFNT